MSTIESKIEELQQQIIDLQIHISHQERTIQQLDEVIQRQHTEIDNIKINQKALIERMQQPSAGEGFSLEEEKPPHY